MRGRRARRDAASTANARDAIILARCDVIARRRLFVTFFSAFFLSSQSRRPRRVDRCVDVDIDDVGARDARSRGTARDAVTRRRRIVDALVCPPVVVIRAP